MLTQIVVCVVGSQLLTDPDSDRFRCKPTPCPPCLRSMAGF